jgi:nucleoside-diphosphate-sugar epimerase
MKSLSSVLAALLLFAASQDDAAALSISNVKSNSINRRDALISGATIIGASTTTTPITWASSTPSAAPIAVLGASGRTGALCVASLLRRGLPVVALTRSGSWPPQKIDLNAVDFVGDATSSNPLLTIQACDIKNAESLASSLSGCRAVIYAASASKKGGNSKDIDGDGVIAAGNACLQQNVGRYVVISSGSTTRPNSLGFKFTELAVAGIMTQKRRGEVGVQDAYSSNQSLSFTILRPGGLDEPKQNIIQGPSALEITQGDVLAGFVSRADVAEVAIELALSSAPNVKNTALELYYRNKVVPVDKGFKKYLENGVDRLHGDSYEELFKGIKPNYDYLVDA